MEDYVLYWYAKHITESHKKQLTDNIKTVYVDKQNYDNLIDFLLENNFVCVEQGYELTGINDLYQYKFIR